MDTYDNSNNTCSQEGSAVSCDNSKKTSPFADSPFVIFGEREGGENSVQVKRKKGTGKIWRRLISAVLVVCIIGGCCGAAVLFTGAYWKNQIEQQKLSLQTQIDKLQAQVNSLEKTQIVISGNEDGEAVTLTPAQIYALCVRGVVSISTGASFGSGFLISADGYVVTNYHVVEGASSLTVITFSEEEYTARIVGYDNANDLAVLKIDASDMPFLEFGSSDVNVGDQVVTIGNPLGELSHSLSTGYVSATDRVVTSEGNKINMIQIDATINSGNSGGPLLNMQGQVIGITSAKYSGTTSSGTIIEGIGFAIPVDDVSGIISDLKEYGYVTGSYLGVAVRDVESSVINNYGLPAGAYVDSVVAGVSAARAGVQAKDIIVAIGDYKITSVTDLTRVLRNFKAGDTTTITVYRAGAEVQLNITLDEKPRN